MKALFVALSVLALLLLAAIVAPSARADLAGATDGSIDNVSEVGESTTSTVTSDEATVTGTGDEDNGFSGGEESKPAPPQQVLADVIPPAAHRGVGVGRKLPPVDDDAVEAVMEAPLVVEEVSDVSGVPLPVGEDLLTVVGVAPVVEVVEDAQPVVEIVDEVRPLVADVVIMVPPPVVDAVPVSLFVSAAVASPGTIEIPTVPSIATVSTRESVVASPPTKHGSQRLSDLITKELVAEMTLFHLTDLTNRSAPGGSASPMPEPQTAALAAYVPIAGPMPVVGGAGASSSTGSSQAGSSSFGGLDAFSFFAAMAVLLALCLVGWIRDRSRSGRSIFPSHGGRPG